jgi:hypothetical protein
LAHLPDDLPRPILTQSVHDWTGLLREAERHGVLGVLAAPLQALEALPPPARGRLEQRRDLERVWHAHLRESLVDVFTELHVGGVPFAALKGPVLAERLYDDASLRRSTDLDLLVTPRDVPAALKILERLGYTPESGTSARYHQEFHHHWCLTHVRRPPLELHFRVYVGFGVQLNADDFLARALPYQTHSGPPCYILSPEDEFLYLCLHAAGHDFARLAWLYDLKLFLRRHPRLHWATVRTRAANAGVATALAFTGRILEERLQASCPELLAAGGRNGRLATARRLLGVRERLAESSRGGKLAALVLQAALCDRPSSGVWLLRHHLTRSARRLLQRRWPRWFPAEWSA